LLSAGDVVTIDFPGVTGVKRRSVVVLSSGIYHAARPDIIVGLITSQGVAPGPTDCVLQDWVSAGLRVPSIFRSFVVTLLPSAHPARIGHLSERDWQAVCARLKASLDVFGNR